MKAKDGTLLDRPPGNTVLYAAQGGYSAVLSAVSPTLAEAQKTWPMSNTAMGLYPSLLAGTMIVSGFGYTRWAARKGRAFVLSVAAGAVALGAVAAALAPSPPVLLLAVAGLGLSTTVVQAGVMSAHVDRGAGHQARRLALNGLCASLASLTGPLAVTVAVHTGLGWRGAWWWLAVVFVVLAVLLPSAVPDGRGAPSRERKRGRLPLPYWCVTAGVAGEICVVFFSPRAVPVAGLVSSGSVLLLYYAGELCGRAVSYGVTFRPGAEGPLLAGSLVLALGGFGAFWLAASTGVRLAGLVAAGAGIANFFPIGASVVSARAPGASDQAMSGLHLLVGAATLTGPLLLGTVADRAGLHAAFALVPSLFLTMAVLLGAGTLTTRRRDVAR
ncbi:MFS transporter [Streptomyces sp. 4F14]|uniref:MFS transporter n=1 Tax=Streptomyces sp. 4F14 TaxID=3394380 RepID=UPI003A8510F7